MKHSSLLFGVLGSSLVLGGAMFTAPRVPHSAGAWYLAGQVKMALGDTKGGLQLMSRAANQRQEEQTQATQKAKPNAAQPVKACSNRSAVNPANASPKAQPQFARLEVPKADPKAAGFSYTMTTEPKVMMASVKFPELPFQSRDLPGMSRGQVAKMNEAIQKSQREWADAQRVNFEHERSLDRERKIAFRNLAQKHKFVRVIVNDVPAGPELPVAPEVSPQP